LNLTSLGWSTPFDRHFEQFRVQGLIPARVAREDRQVYLVFSSQGELAAEVSGRLRHSALSRADFPAVGDWVAIQPRLQERKATIQAVLPRKSAFSRKVAGKNTEEQVLAANIDTVFLVSGLDQDFEVRRIERYLTLAWECGANPVIVLNKVDLCPAVERRVAEVETIAFGVPIHPISATEQQGIDALRPYLGVGRTVALMGSSGVGKSTLINSLLGVERQQVGAVREDDHRGRHTTTYRELVLLPAGGVLVDTPGMRELQMWGDSDNLSNTFEDIEELAAQCRFRDCRHEKEPGCAIRRALQNGTLEHARFQNYLKLQREMSYLEARQNQMVRQMEKARWKKISQWSKQHQKQR
jgi:ribosome biogenesis GTPase / thiamine phosphate phosphatase